MTFLDHERKQHSRGVDAEIGSLTTEGGVMSQRTEISQRKN